MQDFDVYISAKNLDEAGRPTPDVELAGTLYEDLTRRGLRVFFSRVSLEAMGVAAYKRAIDDALDRAKILVVVCSSSSNADSQWVRYEWDSFFTDILSGLKPEGRVFVYLAGGAIGTLPRALRQTQCIEHGQNGFDKLARFVAHALNASLDVPAIHAAADDMPRIDGEWTGQWKRERGRIVHCGRLSISQSHNRLTAVLQVEFQKQGVTTIVREDLRGLLNGTRVVLQGEAYEYSQRGNSRSYLLDHFELEVDKVLSTLAGDFYSKRGRGTATFTRVRRP